MVTVVTNDSCFEFRGLSTDVKPIGSNAQNKNVNYPISNGSVFFEMDTSTAFMLSLTTKDDAVTGEWLEI